MLPVLGSTASASCTNRPSWGSGVTWTKPSADDGASYTKPWGLPWTSTVSSQVSHEPHGVGPPAQLVLVPDRTPQTTGLPGSRGSNSMMVLPPPELAS